MLVVEIRQERGVHDFELGLQPIPHQRRARQAKRCQIRGVALYRVVIDTRNLEQGFKAGLTILAILYFGVVDGVVELSDRPAELNVRLVGGSQCRNWSKKNRYQEQSNGGVDHRAVPKMQVLGNCFGGIVQGHANAMAS